MSTSAQYIASLKFAYLETWCFQRVANEEFNALYRLQETTKLTPEQQERYAELRPKAEPGDDNIFVKGALHPCAVMKSRLSADDERVASLRKILNIHPADVPHWMCRPVYRDAVVFYDHRGQKVSTLYICFTCHSLLADGYGQIDADVTTYVQLTTLFTELGHGLELRGPFG